MCEEKEGGNSKTPLFKKMKKLLFILLTLVFVSIAYGDFNERHVWKALSGITVIHGATYSFGPRDMSDRENEFNVFVFGASNGDSLKTKIDIYGMMNYALADTNENILITTQTNVTNDSTVTLADTLDGNEHFPYIFGKITNNHASASVVFDLYIYSKPREITITRGE